MTNGMNREDDIMKREHIFRGLFTIEQVRRIEALLMKFEEEEGVSQ